MYIIMDPVRMVRVKGMNTRRRQAALKGYTGTILLSGGTNISNIPEDSLISKTSDGVWEAHVKLDDTGRKLLAKELDAIAYL